MRWLRTGIPRSTFSLGALREIGGALTLFKVAKHDREFLLATHGLDKHSEQSGDVSDELIEEQQEAAAEDNLDAGRITQTTRDWLIATLATRYKGHPFAEFCAQLLEAMGYRTQLSPPGRDRGVDIVAHKDPLGLEQPLIKVQCKSSEGQVGDVRALRALGGRVALAASDAQRLGAGYSATDLSGCIKDL